MTGPATILTLDASSRMPMAKRPAGAGEQFRSLLDIRKPAMPGRALADAVEEGGPAPAALKRGIAAIAEALGEFLPAGAQAADALAPEEEETAEGECGEAEADAAIAMVPQQAAIEHQDAQLPPTGPMEPDAPEDSPQHEAAIDAAPGDPETVRPDSMQPARSDVAPERDVGRPKASETQAAAQVKPPAAEPAQRASEAQRPELPKAAIAAVERSDDQGGSGDARQDGNRRGNEAKPMPGVTVVAEAGTPAQPAAQPATRAVVATLGADPAWAAYFRAKPEPAAASAPQSLTIQLRPAELGVVTAHLRFAGDRVAVELQAETAEARRQLASDADTIVRALKATGLEVDQVTVQPVPQSQDAGRGTLTGRNDGTSGGGFASPENPDGRGGRQAGSNGSQGFSGRSGDETRMGSSGADRDGRYI